MSAILTKTSVVRENSFAVAPTDPELQEVRIVNSTLQHSPLTVISAAVRSDRNREEIIHVGKTAAGGIGTELLVGGHDDFLLGALRISDWTSGNEQFNGVVDATAGTIVREDGQAFASGFLGARFVKVSWCSEDGNNGIKRVLAATSNRLYLEGLTADETAFMRLDYCYGRGGNETVSLTIEQEYSGGNIPRYTTLHGIEVSKWTLSVPARGIINQQFDLMGAFGQASEQSLALESATEPTYKRPCDATNSTGTLRLDGLEMPAIVLEFSMTLDNTLRARPAVSREHTLPHGAGRLCPDGTLTIYYERLTELRKLLDKETASIEVPIVDADGNLLSLFVPNATFTGGWPTVGGHSDEMTIPLRWSASIHHALGYGIQVDRLDSAEPEMEFVDIELTEDESDSLLTGVNGTLHFTIFNNSGTVGINTVFRMTILDSWTVVSSTIPGEVVGEEYVVVLGDLGSFESLELEVVVNVSIPAVYTLHSEVISDGIEMTEDFPDNEVDREFDLLAPCDVTIIGGIASGGDTFDCYADIEGWTSLTYAGTNWNGLYIVGTPDLAPVGDWFQTYVTEASPITQSLDDGSGVSGSIIVGDGP